MESILFALVIILINAITISVFLKKKIDETIIVSMIFLSLILYICGLIGNLQLGIKFIEITTFFEIICVLSLFIKSNEKVKIVKNILTPGLMIYFIFVLISIFINKNEIFKNYDEFNHWAVRIKSMYIYNSFYSQFVRFNEYPPFTSIIQYLFLGFKNIYREDIIIISQNILYFSIMLPLIKRIEWNKDIKKLLTIIPIIIFLPMIFYQSFYNNILVDGLLGVMLAYLLYQLIEDEENILFKYIKIFSGLIMLSLTKTTGIALALLCVFVIALKVFKNKDNKNEKKLFLIIISLTALLVVMWYIGVNRQQQNWDFTNYTKLTKIFNIEAIEVGKSILKTLFTGKLATIRKIPIIYFIICNVLIEIIMLCHIKKHQYEKYNNYKYYSIILLITIPIYIIGMYISYLTIFEKIEASNLTSFARYISTILLANLLFHIAYVINMKESKFKKIFIVTTAIIIVLFLPYKHIKSEIIYDQKYSNVLKKKLNKRNSAIKVYRYATLLKSTDKILYITAEPMQYTNVIKQVQYEIMPITINKITLEDISSKEEFENIFANYNYIYIDSITDNCSKLLKDKFENNYIKKETLYVLNNNNILKEVGI